MAFKGTLATHKAISKAYGWGSFLGKLGGKEGAGEALVKSHSFPAHFATPQELRVCNGEVISPRRLTFKKVAYTSVAAGYQHGFIGFMESDQRQLSSFGLNTSGQLGTDSAILQLNTKAWEEPALTDAGRFRSSTGE